MTLQEWTNIFKGLANKNRLRIILLLSRRRELPVSYIADKLNISVASVSQHLIHLTRLGIVDSEGRAGKVYYTLAFQVSSAARSAIKSFLSDTKKEDPSLL